MDWNLRRFALIYGTVLLPLIAISLFVGYNISQTDLKLHLLFGQQNWLDENQVLVQQRPNDYFVSPQRRIPNETLVDDGNKNEGALVEKACKFPQLLVDDPLIKPHLVHFDPVQCAPEQNWVYTKKGVFYISGDAEKRHGRIKCKYWRVDRINDGHYVEIPLNDYKNGTPVDGYGFLTKCKATDGAKYYNHHATVPTPQGSLASRLHKAKQRRAQSAKGLNMNVLIYLMDSVSRLNFIRKLPGLYKLLTEEMNAYIMEGYNVVGDGTSWAIIPMLTGNFQYDLSDARKRFDNTDYLDDWPFIFKNFTEAGYITSYAEEQPGTSPFTLKLNGFDASPVDHYYRSFLLSVVSASSQGHHKPYCLGDKPVSIALLELWREMQDVYRPFDGRQFSMLFSAEASHNEYNPVQMLDAHWVDHFGSLHRDGYFNDTILFVMGDHGCRYGPARQTQNGKLEEKLPFMAVVVPPWFRKKYPLSDANLRKNQNRLITVFDLHQTFFDVLNFQQDGGVGNVSNRGISLFKEIPLERTCAHAHIKAHFCSCLEWTEVRDLKNQVVVAAAQTVIDYFNNQAKEMNGRCAKLTLGNIVSARLLIPNEKLLLFKESLDIDSYTPNLSDNKMVESILYQIRFTTEPGGGDWEASLSHFLKFGKFGVSPDDISRLNRYNEQAQCVMQLHPHLRTFCYCL